MEGVAEPLGRMVEAAYHLSKSARALTASMVAGGEKPAVISALLKYRTHRRRAQAVNDAMDIHGGRAICDGPRTIVLAAYQTHPGGITVEGANILTRTLITFAQGALRAIPISIKEVEAAQNRDEDAGLQRSSTRRSRAMSASCCAISSARFLHASPSACSPSRRTARHSWRIGTGRPHRAARNFALVAD